MWVPVYVCESECEHMLLLVWASTYVVCVCICACVCVCLVYVLCERVDVGICICSVCGVYV